MKDLSDFLVANREGICIRQEGIDAIWPEDDREPLLLDGKTPLKLPPTCLPGVQTFEEQVGRDTLLAFFDGEPLPHGQVPLPSTAGLMIGVICVFVLITIWRKCDDLEKIR